MEQKPMPVHEVAELTGITVRTLHYYDEIGLLKPEIVTESKYRYYTKNDMERLQEILFFKEAGFALKEIKTLITSEAYDREAALKRHLQILKQQKRRMESIIELVNNRISGGEEYSFEAFSMSRINELQARFRDELMERWGDTESYREYKSLFDSKSKKIREEQWNHFLMKAKNLFEHLSEYENESPANPEVQKIVEEWKNYISENFYTCDNRRLMYLGELYTTDDRFGDFINRFGNGDLALFFYEAIKIYCSFQGK